MKLLKAFFVLVACCGLFSACESVYDDLDASPLSPTSFLPDHQLLVKQAPSFPFQYLWYRQNYDWNRFKKIKFAQVDTSHMLSDSWWQSVSEAQAAGMKAQSEQIAQYMRNEFIHEIVAKPGDSFVITEKVDSETVVVQLALVQLVPTKAFFNAIATTAGFFIPGASLLGMADAGSVAMECKIMDGRDGAVIAMLADREKDRTVLISVDNYTWYGHSKEIIDSWAKSFAEMTLDRNARHLGSKEFPVSIISLP